MILAIFFSDNRFMPGLTSHNALKELVPKQMNKEKASLFPQPSTKLCVLFFCNNS